MRRRVARRASYTACITADVGYYYRSRALLLLSLCSMCLHRVGRGAMGWGRGAAPVRGAGGLSSSSSYTASSVPPAAQVRWSLPS
jgi:hypothetical protein